MPAKVRGLTRRKGETVWSFDFWIRGHRFCGSTGHAARRDAEKWIEAFRAEKKSAVAAFDGEAPMSFAVAASRWYEERGKHRKDWKDVERFLEWLRAQLGDVMLAAIDNNRVARLVTTRRAEAVSPATVNRSCIEPLRAILRRAKFWGQRVHEIEWAEHLLPESDGSERLATSEEVDALFAEIRNDFHAALSFEIVQAWRRAEVCNLRWEQIDWEGRAALIPVKGGEIKRRPLAAAAMSILQGEKGRHPEFVFTYEVRHAWGGKKGSRARILPDTLSTAYWRARRRAAKAMPAIRTLRLHDLRHTTATRVLNLTGNLRVVQGMLGHQRITTTQRYTHLIDDHIRDAIDKAATKSPAKVPKKVEQSPAAPRKQKPRA